MLRETTMEAISDGKIYGLNDMVKADTGGCRGCSKCCTGMGSSIVLDPYDVWLLKSACKKSLQELLDEGRIELNMVDGLIMPNIKMGEDERCTFLDADGRCSIHAYRPGICRLFPLGRVYQENGFAYFLQKNECVRENRAKIKVKKWIDTECIPENQRFIAAWHTFIRSVGDAVISLHEAGRGEQVRDITMYVLNEFYVSDIADEEAVENAENDHAYIYERLMRKIEMAKNMLRV